MPKKGSSTLFYVDSFDEGLRSDVTADKAPPGSLTKANNVRYIPSGGFSLRKGNKHMSSWVPGTSYAIEQFGKCIEHGALFIKSGTKIMQTISESGSMYDIGWVGTAGHRGIFREYNSEMKYTNGKDIYLSITVGRVLTAFDQDDTSILMDQGNADLFRTPKTGSLIVNASTDTITATAHDLSNGDRVAFYSSLTLPAGISANTEYFVRNVDTNTFQISTTPTGDILDITDTGSNATFTVDDSTDVFTSAGHGLSNGDIIQVSTTGTLPTGLSASTNYYIINKTTDTFQVSTAEGGSAVDMSSTGSGTHTWTIKATFTDGILYCKGSMITYNKKKTATFTADAGTDFITSADHLLTNGDIINVETTSALPGGLSASTNYYIINATDDTFQVSATEGGAKVNITDVGTGTHTFVALKGGDTFGECRIQSGTYESGAIVTQTKDIPNAPKATVIESIFEKMVAGGTMKAGHVEYYTASASAATPESIDDYYGAGADTELFGKYGTITAMESLLTKMYVAKQKGIEAWTGIDADGIPVREPFTDSYGIVNHDCLVQMGDKLAMFTDTRRQKTIEPDTTGANPEPIINPFFDRKITGTLRSLDSNQDRARMGYNEIDQLLRNTVEKDDVLQTLIYDTETQGYSIDTGYAPGCWIDWNGSMYFGDANEAKVYKAETEYTDASSNPSMDAVTPIHFVGDRRRKVLVQHIFLTGLIKTRTAMTVEIYADGELHRSTDLSGDGSYVSKSVFRPFGRDSLGRGPLGRSGGSPEEDEGYEFAVPIDVNVECRYIQIRFLCQGTGYGVQIDSYEGVAGESSNSMETQIEAI